MAGEQIEFVKRIAASWRQEFPFLKPVYLKEIPQVPKGCNFLCDAYGSSRERYYFILLVFSQKKRGEFSIEIVVSPSADRSTMGPATGIPSPRAIGTFGIWQFMRRQRFAWALVDLAADTKALLGISSGLPPSPNVWRPATYNQPLENIIDEAISHVNQTLRASVFPVLQIEIAK